MNCLFFSFPITEKMPQFTLQNSYRCILWYVFLTIFLIYPHILPEDLCKCLSSLLFPRSNCSFFRLPITVIQGEAELYFYSPGGSGCTRELNLLKLFSRKKAYRLLHMRGAAQKTKNQKKQSQMLIYQAGQRGVSCEKVSQPGPWEVTQQKRVSSPRPACRDSA